MCTRPTFSFSLMAMPRAMEAVRMPADQTVFGIVGQSHPFVIVIEDRDAYHRPENFFAKGSHDGRDAGRHGRRVERSLRGSADREQGVGRQRGGRVQEGEVEGRNDADHPMRHAARR